MKIACITEDGKTISQHFGRAPYYVVFTIDDGAVVATEMRDKLGHQHFSTSETYQEHVSPRGTDPASHERHLSMAQTIADCEALLCGGMGYGAYQSMQRLGIKPVVTDLADAESAALAYVRGEVVDHTERLH
ncbi:MAG: dinitrogenase iron-molybdenum cofactor biosynthesis protein [Chloroflexi bacterium]|nr:dinitrogenase iron-molybdenum cofactor biosynthesis protein [Chloroflexota bacterium]